MRMILSYFCIMPGQISINDLNKRLVKELSDHYDTDEAVAIARVYLEDTLDLSGYDLIRNGKQPVPGDVLLKLENDIVQLTLKVPVQYVTGKAVFCGFPFKVSPHVLIPRPETEELVEWIVSENRIVCPVIIDICTGSGCIAIALAKKIKQAGVTGTDISPEALMVAESNAAMNSVQVSFTRDDVASSELETYIKEADIIVANPPYIPIHEKDQLDPNVLLYEPHIALFPGKDAFLFYRYIVDVAVKTLKPGGRLYFEIDKNGGAAVRSLLTDAGFGDIVVRKDLNRNERMICGVLKNKYF